jgi:hypothetical protein
VRRSGILPGARIGDCDRLDHGPGADEVALGLWEELFDLTVRQAATPPADPQPPLNALSDWAGRWAPRALTMLYERQAAIDLADLVANLVSERHAAGDHGEPAEGAFLAALLGLTVRGTLAELADHGAVTHHHDRPARQPAPNLSWCSAGDRDARLGAGPRPRNHCPAHTARNLGPATSPPDRGAEAPATKAARP